MGLYDDMILYGNKQGKIKPSLGSTGRNIYSTSSGTPNQQVNSYISANQLSKETRRANAQMSKINTPTIGNTTEAASGSSWVGRNSGVLATGAISGATAYISTPNDPNKTKGQNTTNKLNNSLEAISTSIPIVGQYLGLAYTGRDLTKGGLDSGVLGKGRNEYGDYTTHGEQGMDAALTTVHEQVLNKAGNNDWLGAAQSVFNPAGDILKGFFGEKDNSGEKAFKQEEALRQRAFVAEQERMNAMNNPYSKYETSSAPSGNPYIAGRAIVNGQTTQAKNGGYINKYGEGGETDSLPKSRPVLYEDPQKFIDAKMAYEDSLNYSAARRKADLAGNYMGLESTPEQLAAEKASEPLFERAIKSGVTGIKSFPTQNYIQAYPKIKPVFFNKK